MKVGLVALEVGDRCPHSISKRAGDETYYFCELTERPSGRIKPCLVEYGDKCEIWNELKEEDGD